MTSKERVMAAIEHRRPDRLPVWDGCCFPGFVSAWQKKYGFAGTDPLDFYSNDVSVHVADECFYPSERRVLYENGGSTVLLDGWGRTVRTAGDGYFSETIETKLAYKGQLDRIPFESPENESRYPESFLDGVAEAEKKGRCVFAKVGGIYIRSHFLRGEENLLCDMASDPAFCDELFGRVTDHLTGMALKTLHLAGATETGLWVYDDMAGLRAPMFSPAMFERYFLPRYAGMIAACRAAGCRHFFLHSDGSIGPLIPLLLNAGFEGFNPLEPRCVPDLSALREKYPEMILFGGVCNTRVLPRGSREEIAAHLAPLCEMGREGGVVAGTASVDDTVAPEAYDFYRRYLRENGGYAGGMS